MRIFPIIVIDNNKIKILSQSLNYGLFVLLCFIRYTCMGSHLPGLKTMDWNNHDLDILISQIVNVSRNKGQIQNITQTPPQAPNMLGGEITFFLYILHMCSCSWISEWMTPVKEQIKGTQTRKNNENFPDYAFEEDALRMAQAQDFTGTTPSQMMYPRINVPPVSLKMTLETTLQNAKILANALKSQIIEVTTRENLLKDAIVNGRSGVSAVSVTTMGRPRREYMVRDGIWSQCSGMVQFPGQASFSNQFGVDISTPRCIGHEISTQRDPCVFNSMIKYETVPTIRRLEYSEDDFLCLKNTFNTSLERYMSVPRQVINETCQNGIVRSLEDNEAKCGFRVMAEYTYYPTRGYAASSLPLEYCLELDGACKLIVAWHVTNATIENFEFLKNEKKFKEFFIKSGSFVHVI